MSRFVLSICILFSVIVQSALADEQIDQIAQSGDWIAVEHRVSMTDPPDVCLAEALEYGFALRSDDSDNEIRYGNTGWSLPADVAGKLLVIVNGHTYSYDITSNTNISVAVVLTDDDLQKLVADMNVAFSMTVTAGSAQPATVPLDGSTTVVTAYLTCAGKNQPGSTGGTNPFQ